MSYVVKRDIKKGFTVDTYMVLNSPNLMILEETDFTIDTEYGIGLRYNDCIVILFHGNDPKSVKAVNAFGRAAENEKLQNVLLGSVNLELFKKLQKSFEDLSQSMDHPYSWAGKVDPPFILSYKSGFPQGFYSGEMNAREIAKWAEKGCPAGTTINPGLPKAQIDDHFYLHQ